MQPRQAQPLARQTAQSSPPPVRQLWRGRHQLDDRQEGRQIAGYVSPSHGRERRLGA
jgi:hypothetical protein